MLGAGTVTGAGAGVVMVAVEEGVVSRALRFGAIVKSPDREGGGGRLRGCEIAVVVVVVSLWYLSTPVPCEATKLDAILKSSCECQAMVDIDRGVTVRTGRRGVYPYSRWYKYYSRASGQHPHRTYPQQRDM